MWTCRKCSAEVEDNFEICWSCGTSVDGAYDPNFRRFDNDADVPAPPSTAVVPKAAGSSVATAEKLVTVATYWVAGQAHEVQCLLELDGIAVFVAYEFAIAKDWFLDNATGSIQLQVAEADVEKARKVLADHPKEAAPLPPPPKKPPEPDEEERYKDAPWKAPIPKGLNTLEELRLLESQLSSLIDSKDVPDWKVNPAFHPDVMAFIQKHANNSGFVQKAQGLQRNRAKYFATIRAEALKPKPVEEKAETKESKTSGPGVGAALQAGAKRWLVEAPLGLAKRSVKWVIVLLVVTVIGGLGAAFIHQGYGSKQLENVIREIEEKDPDWTWEALQAKRKKIEDKDNAALRVDAIAAQLPENWSYRVGQLTRAGEPKGQLDDKDIDLIRDELAKCRAALEEARGLEKLSEGSWPADALRRGKGKRGFSATHCVEVAELLYLDALVQANKQRPGQALASARAAMVAGRAVGDGPGSDAQIMRVGSTLRACGSIQRTLRQVEELSDNDLLITQRLIESEIKEPLLWLALRGDRATADIEWAEVEAAHRDVLALDRAFGAAPNEPELVTADTPLAPVERWLRGGQDKLNKAQYLKQLTNAIDLAIRPIEEHAGKWSTFDGPPGLPGVAKAFIGGNIRLRCTAAALAAERYRVANGQWPTTWDALVPNYLSGMPVDPYGGQPLQLKRLDDGLEVSSAGPGVSQNKPIAFRLWDVNKRGAADVAK
jgi:hypothetical protein